MTTPSTPDIVALVNHFAALERRQPESVVIRPLRRAAQRRFDASPVWRRGLVAAA